MELLMRAQEFVSEAITRRGFVQGAAAAAAGLGAVGAQAGEYQDLETIKKQPDVWIPRIDQLQQRSNGILGKLMRAAGPEWAQRLQGTRILVSSNDQWMQGNATNRSISIDITVFWDAPDDVLAFAIAHELGHIALAHTDQPNPVMARQEEMDADDFAIRLCRALGYTKAGLFKFLHKKQADYDYINSIASQPDSNHPTYDQRINNAGQKGFQLSRGGIQQMNTLQTHLAESRLTESTDSTPDLDRILVELCAMVVKGKQRNPDYYGMVAAAVVDPDGRVVKAVNHRDDAGDKRIHGERAAIEAYERKHGRVTPDCTIVTTLSPCSERMDDRYGESCEDLLDDYGITDIYCGYQDPTQDSGYTVTDNEKIQELCKAFADTFLGDQQLDELSFLGSPCTKDCSGHRAGYDWSAKKGNITGTSPYSPSFNNGANLRAAGK